MRYFFLFILVISLYCILYAPFGLNDVDEGFILSQSYRINNGEIPYKDFEIIRTIFTPYFHALILNILPESFEVLGERYLFYIFMALSSLFCSLTIYRYHKIINPFLLATLGFIISVNHFPPMAWHTIDGLLFASLGAYLITNDKPFPLFFGIVSILVSALCKQSFFPLTVLIILLKAFQSLPDNQSLDYYFKRLLFTLIVLLFSSTLTLILFPIIKETPTTSLSVYDLIQYGFLNYFHLSVIRVLFIFSFLVYVYKKEWELLFLLSISWCASLSWGYPAPTLFSLPIIFSLIYFLHLTDRKRQIKATITPSVIFVVVLAFFNSYMEYKQPYLNPPKDKLKYFLSQTYPKLTGIKVSEETKEKYEELSELSKRYEPFVVMPELPWAYYLLNKRNPVSVDWIFNAEVPDGDKLLKELETKKPFVFISKYPQIIATSPFKNKSSSLIAFHITKNWWKIKETKYFEVYRY